MATGLVILIIGGWTAYCLIRLRSKKNRGRQLPGKAGVVRLP